MSKEREMKRNWNLKDRSKWKMGGAKSQIEDQILEDYRKRLWGKEKWTTLDAKLTVLLKLNYFNHI